MAQTLLKISCPDQVGLLSRLTQFIACQGGNLLEVHQFTDPLNRWFFARLAIDSDTLPLDLAALRAEFAPVAESIEARWLLHDASQRSRVVIIVSKAGHCLMDLLGRWRNGELPIDIAAVIGNHEQLRPLVEREGIPFEYVPVTPENKAAAFEAMNARFEELRADLIVLARYMQIIPPELCQTWKNRIINIHHSFLPSFAGANPYRRAYERGVKLIGATCHYATADLDQGPIIDQEVIRVEHFHTPDDLLRMGRDCERLALARGVRYHVGERVLVHKGRSIVFRD
ncbi:MAG TPA: formyltetrahydrofolate deformylase [Chthoniobacteraceae bacterium]|nr:formyltetrahydrofolate deformylase [Chthoniobacteraceae bacterium]